MSQRVQDRWGETQQAGVVGSDERQLKTKFTLGRVLDSETHPVRVTRGPFSWLGSVVTVKARRAPAWGGRDTSATMWELLVRREADPTDDTAP